MWEPTIVVSPSPVALWNGDVFPEWCSIADLRASEAALPFQILGLEADAGEREDFIVRCPSRVWPSITTCECSRQPRPQRHVLADDAIGADPALVADLALWDERPRKDGPCDVRVFIGPPSA